jgi:hypothetical protein
MCLSVFAYQIFNWPLAIVQETPCLHASKAVKGMSMEWNHIWLSLIKSLLLVISMKQLLSLFISIVNIVDICDRSGHSLTHINLVICFNIYMTCLLLDDWLLQQPTCHHDQNIPFNNKFIITMIIKILINFIINISGTFHQHHTCRHRSRCQQNYGHQW